MPSDSKKKKEQQKKEARKKSSRKPNSKLQNEENDENGENEESENTSLNGDADADVENGEKLNEATNGNSEENGNEKIEKEINNLQKKFVNFELIEKSNAENRSCTGNHHFPVFIIILNKLN